MKWNIVTPTMCISPNAHTSVDCQNSKTQQSAEILPTLNCSSFEVYFLEIVQFNKFSGYLLQTRWNFLIFYKVFAWFLCGLIDAEANLLTSLYSAISIVLVFQKFLSAIKIGCRVFFGYLSFFTFQKLIVKIS